VSWQPLPLLAGGSLPGAGPSSPIGYWLFAMRSSLHFAVSCPIRVSPPACTENEWNSKNHANQAFVRVVVVPKIQSEDLILAHGRAREIGARNKDHLG
jgi:hypothetical protein